MVSQDTPGQAERAGVMGICNVTPDSFSDGGYYLGAEAAVSHGRAMFAAGADIVDVGGESTRPGAEPVGADEQLGRIGPVIGALVSEGRVSVDTRDAEVARGAVDAGASLINDVSAGLAPVAAELGVGWVAVHMAGDPTTMQDDPRYDDVVAEVSAFLADRAAEAVDLGVEEVWVDPGIGFGKTAGHNLALLAGLDQMVAGGHPVMVGTSRKGFLGGLAARADGVGTPRAVDDRLEGSVATAVAALVAGAAMVRVHDVATTVTAATLAAVRHGPVRAVGGVSDPGGG